MSQRVTQLTIRIDRCGCEYHSLLALALGLMRMTWEQLTKGPWGSWTPALDVFIVCEDFPNLAIDIVEA